MALIALDTNTYSALMRGDQRVAAVVRSATELALSAVVVGELLYGFRCGSRYETNLTGLHTLVSRPFTRVLDVTWVTADRYARIAKSLREKGRPLPVNDIWIAAHAMESGAELLSYDQHFAHIDGLVWTCPT